MQMNKQLKSDFKLLRSLINRDLQTNKKSIYFMHIPKCGGTTIDHIFLKLSLALGSFKFKRFKYPNVKQSNKFTLKNVDDAIPTFISGHLDYNFTKNLENVFKCTIIRNPLDRVLSHYKFSLFKKNKNPTEYSLDNFIKDEIDNYRENLVTRHFSGMLKVKKRLEENDKQKALENIEIFDQIDIFDNWDYFVSKLLSKYGLPSILYSRYQEHSYDFVFNPNQSEIDLIREHYKYDFEMYNEVLKSLPKKEKNTEINYNDKICIVSPYIKSQNRLYEINELKKYFKIKK